MLIDTFMVNNEMDMLECRLYEIGDVVDYFVAVEADVDHQDHPKPYHLTETLAASDRFDRWRHKLVVVQAKNLPTFAENPDPWAREMGQREWVREGIDRLDAPPDAVVLHGDIDEIPTVLAARNVNPANVVSFHQRGLFWAVDWDYPPGWRGTVAAKLENIRSFGVLRNTRNLALPIFGGGWHLSWLGGRDAALGKLGSFCHPEVADRIDAGLADGQNRFVEEGRHVDGQKLVPVDVDKTWPKWVFERKCPQSWFRPR